MNKRTMKNVITKCGADFLTPFVLVYMFYVILHGHLSPGGGFQGGVLAVAVIVFIHVGHGYENTVKMLNIDFMRRTEGFAVTAYIVIAFLGVVFAAQFCENFAFDNGNIGDLLSSGTIAWMDEAVGLKVITGVSVLTLSALGVLARKDGE